MTKREILRAEMALQIYLELKRATRESPYRIDQDWAKAAAADAAREAQLLLNWCDHQEKENPNGPRKD